MDAKNLFLILLCSLWASTSKAQTFSAPVEYLSYINEEYKLMSKDMWNYTKAVAHNKNARKIENRRRDLMLTFQNSKKKIGRMPSYEGNTSLRDSIVSYLNISYLILKEDYAKIVDLEEIAEQSYDLMEAYMLTMQEADKKREIAIETVDREVDKFAEEFNIILQEPEESKLSKKLSKANEVYAYYNPIYLIFFKSYKQEFYLIESLNNNDMAAFEQNRNALSDYASEGLEKIRQKPGFGRDVSLKRSCQQLLMFYQTEANEKAPLYTDFYLKKEHMEQLQKAIESKPKSKLTKEEIDAYNKSINEYNKSLQTFNKINKDVNNQRNTYLGQWNKMSKAFFDTHVP